MTRKITQMETLEVSTVGQAANRRMFAIAKRKENKMGNLLNDEVTAVLNTPAQDEEVFLKSLDGKDLDDKGKAAALTHFRIQKGLKDLVDGDMMQLIGAAAGYVQNTAKQAEPVQKKLDPESEAIFKKNQELETRLLKMEETADLKEHISKAAQSFDHVPGEANELGGMLHEAHKVSKKLGDQIEGLFGKVNEAIKKSGVLQEVGHSQVSNGFGDSAKAQLFQKTEQLMKDGNIKKSAAMRQVIEADPNLYERYVDEQRARK